MAFEPRPTLSSMSAPSPRPPPWWSAVLAALGVVVAVAAAGAGVSSVLSPQVSGLEAETAAHAHALLTKLSFPRPVLSTARDRALELVEAEARAAGASIVMRRHGVQGAGNTFIASDVVLASVKGTGGGSRVLISAHVDSVPNVAAAGDDGAGVVAALEALRAAAHQPPAGDVVVAITGQEELCVSCGAALVDASFGPFDVVINLDSGGDEGPFAETQSIPSAGDGALFALLAKTPAFASSTIDGFSRVFAPAEGRTELASFASPPQLRVGARAHDPPAAHPSTAHAPESAADVAAAIDLGFLGGRRCYHAPCDDGAHLDEPAFDDAVAAVTQLARAAAASPAGTFRASGANTADDPNSAGVIVALPSMKLAIPGGIGAFFAVLTALAGLGVSIACGFKRFRDFAAGIASSIFAVVAAGGAFVLGRAAASLALGSAASQAQGPLAVGAGLALAFGAAVAAAQVLGRGRTLAFSGGTALPFVAATAGAAFANAELGGSVAVPALFVVVAAALGAFAGNRLAPLALAIAAVATYFCGQTGAVLALAASDLDEIVVVGFGAVVAALCACAIAPLASRTHTGVALAVAIASAVGAVCLVVIAVRTGSYDAGHPQPVSLSYAQSSSRAFLYSDDDAPAPAVTARLGTRAAPTEIEDVFPGEKQTRVAAPVASQQLALPSIDVVDVIPTAAGKTWRLALYSNRGARELRLTVHGGARAFRMGGAALAPCRGGPCTLRIVGATNAIVDVELDEHQVPDVTLSDVTLGLPAALARPWPAGIASSPRGDRSVTAMRVIARPR
jgi:hypothetical protein